MTIVGKIAVGSCVAAGVLFGGLGFDYVCKRLHVKEDINAIKLKKMAEDIDDDFDDEIDDDLDDDNDIMVEMASQKRAETSDPQK